MKKLITFLFAACMVVFANAQVLTGVIKQASEPPVINGEIDAVWEDANVYDIERYRGANPPSLGQPGETTWRALWDANGIYVLLVVNDNVWFPSYISGGNSWEYDKPEIYFDVNYILEDGIGPMTGQGHYQVAPAAIQANIGGIATTEGSGVVWAFKVADPSYVAEYFVPWTYLLDKEGLQFDKTATMGFDVTIIDRDTPDVAQIGAVWSNNTDGDSWSNMDDAGRVTFEGATSNILIDEIVLTGGVITEDNGTLQVQTEITPANATIKNLRWRLENKTGRARISQTGLVTAIADGTVTISAESTDGSYVFSNEVDIEISGQITTMWELNVIRNGLFDQVNENGTATHWGGWGGDANSPLPTIQNGVAVATPILAGDVWQYQFSQNQLSARPDIDYIFEFVAWADAPRTFTVDFEDIAGNGHNRYGSTQDPRSANGRSEWTFDVTAEPTRYTFDVIFDEIVANTDQKVVFMLAHAAEVTYIDSVMLIAVEDMGLVSTREAGANLETSFKVYPNPAVNEINVVLNSSNETVSIYNTLGVRMEEVKVSGTHHKFNVSSYPKGIYFVRTNNTVVKFIVLE